MTNKRLFLASALVALGCGLAVPGYAYTRRIHGAECTAASGLSLSTNGINNFNSASSIYQTTCGVGDVPNQDHSTITGINIDGYDASTSYGVYAEGCVINYSGTSAYCGNRVYSSNGTGGSSTETASYTGAFYMYMPIDVITGFGYTDYYAYVNIGVPGNSSRVTGIVIGN